MTDPLDDELIDEDTLDEATDGDDADADDETDRLGATAAQIGDALGRLGAAVLFVPLGIAGRAAHAGTKGGLSFLTLVIPFFGKVHESLAKWALYKYYKKSSGDAIGLIHEPNGQVDLLPVKYKEQSVDEDEVERAGWHALGRERSWHEGADGREVDRIGRTPIVLLDSASTQRATATEARFSECLDLGQKEKLYRVPDRSALDVTVQVGGPGAGAAGNGHAGARADGGVQMDILEANAQKAIWEQSVVDIGTDDHDGMRINPRKVKETYREQTGSEQLDEVERLGFLAGKVGSNVDSGFVVKVLLIALGIVAAATIGPDLLGTASNAGGGGGGGGIMPFMLGW